MKTEDSLGIQLRNSVHRDIEAKRDTKSESDEDMTKRTGQKGSWKKGWTEYCMESRRGDAKCGLPPVTRWGKLCISA